MLPMSLANLFPIGFIPIRDADAALAFYQRTLGLTFQADDGFAIVFRLGPVRGLILRLVRMPEYTPAPYTIFGWEVPDIVRSVDDLSAKGVSFTRYDHLQQDERGIWSSPSGARVAWFKDPDGNTLSLSQHEP